MTQENLFRILTIFTALGFGILWARNLASQGVSRDKLYTPAESALFAALRLVLLGASLLGMLVYCISPRLMDWSALPLPGWLRAAGFLVALGAIYLFQRVLRTLGHNFSTSLTLRGDQTLVTDGPYRRVRHPMYTAFVGVWLGFLLLTANWFIGCSGLLLFGLTMLLRTPQEERMMIERFGDDYRAYMRRTGRYLPMRISK